MIRITHSLYLSNVEFISEPASTGSHANTWREAGQCYKSIFSVLAGSLLSNLWALFLPSSQSKTYFGNLAKLIDSIIESNWLFWNNFREKKEDNSERIQIRKARRYKSEMPAEFPLSEMSINRLTQSAQFHRFIQIRNQIKWNHKCATRQILKL